MGVYYREIPGGLLSPEILTNGRNLICLQSNCVATKRHTGSIHDELYKALGFGDPYKIREAKHRNLAMESHRPQLGSFLIMRDKKEPYSKCGLAFLFAQYNMGDGNRLYFSDKEYEESCKRIEWKRDIKCVRLQAFKECLNGLLKSPLCGFDNIYFPDGIGCFRAGGHWPDYEAAIEKFSNETTQRKKIFIVKKKNDAPQGMNARQ